MDAQQIKVDTEEFRGLLDKLWDAPGSIRAARARNAIFRHVEALLAAEVERLRAELASGAAKGGDTKYGCHCDLEPGMEPDGCVIDTNRREDCVYARRISTKEECDYWAPIHIAATTASDKAQHKEKA